MVWMLDCIGRSLEHLIETVSGLSERGVGFLCLQEAIETMTSGGKLVFHVVGALAEFKRASVRRHRCAQRGSSMRRSIRPKRATGLYSGRGGSRDRTTERGAGIERPRRPVGRAEPIGPAPKLGLSG
jgi:DNA invertase Pin-like site-specific DNA recombinase